MGIKYGSFDSLEEQINNILNTNALLIILNDRGLISPDEFYKAKQEALNELKREYPDLFE